jgi:hypothetical protein
MVKQSKRRKRITWTKELDQQLVSLRELGVKPRAIAGIMGMPRIAIYNRSARLGLSKMTAQLEMDLQVAPDTKTEFRESPKRRELPTYIDEATRVPADYVIDQQPKPSKPKPTWWKQMMWWRK